MQWHNVGRIAIGATLASLAMMVTSARPARAQAAAPDSAALVRIDTLLGLDEVVARALAVSPVMAQGEGGVRAARSGERVATGAYLPSISATSSLLRSNALAPSAGAPLPASDDAAAAGLAASLDVFTAGRRGAERARAAADVRAAESERVGDRYAVTLQATRAFFEALRASDLVAVANARIATGEHGFRFARDRVLAGVGTRSDELRAQLELTTARQQLVASLDTLQTAAFALGRIVGADGAVGARPAASLEPRPLALGDSEIVRLAVEASPLVRAAEAEARAGEAGVRAARTQYVPSLRLSGGYNWATQSRVLSAVRPGWALTLGTSYPLFNGFQREDVVERASVTSDVARVAAADQRRLARAEAARLLGALRLAERNIALAAEAVRAAEEDLRVQSSRYRAGISTTLDLLTSELAVTQARLGLVAARHGYQITRATLESLVGRAL
jgi:outer membrane protein TolC